MKQQSNCPDEDCPHLLDDGNCAFVECVAELEREATKIRNKRKKTKEKKDGSYNY